MAKTEKNAVETTKTTAFSAGAGSNNNMSKKEIVI